MSDTTTKTSGNAARTLRAALAALAVTLLAVAGAPALAVAAPVFDVTLEGGYSEVQVVEIRATSGQFRLRFGDGGPGVAETGDLPYNATPVQVQNALNALVNVSGGGGAVSVAGGGGGQNRVTFNGGSLYGTDVPTLVPVEGTTPLVSAHADKLTVDTIERAGVRRNDRRIDYYVGVRNDLPAVAAPAVGDLLACNGTAPAKNWLPAGFQPHQYDFEWRRNGVVIPGESEAAYTAQVADVGAAVQCLVKGTNAAAAAKFPSLPAVIVGSASTPAPPASAIPAATGAASRPTIAPTTGPVGVVRTCGNPTNWTAGGTPVTFSYQWLRNGDEIDGATANTYTPVAEDDGKVVQCMVTGTTGTGTAPDGGALVAASPISAVGAVSNPPTLLLSVVATPNVLINGLLGATVEVELPSGLGTSAVKVYNASDSNHPPLNNSECSVQAATAFTPAKAICTSSDIIAAQQAFPRIGIGIGLGADAPDVSTVTATVTGGGVAEPVTEVDQFEFAGPGQPFGLTTGTLVTALLGSDYNPAQEYTQAGGHPAAATARVDLNSHRSLESERLLARMGPTEAVKQLRTDTPPGLVGNPLAATVLCDDPQKLFSNDENCPAGSVVGEARFKAYGTGTGLVGHGWARKPLVALRPERGEVAQFAFADGGSGGIYVLNARLRPEDGYAVSIDAAPIVQTPAFIALGATICSYGANASAPNLSVATTPGCKQPGDPGAFEKPLLTAPTACGETLVTRMSADSWENPGVFSSLAVEEPAITGCELVPFTPTVVMSPTSSVADSPSGLEASISVPSDGLEDPEGIAQAHLKKTVVELPAGVSVNPSAATGLEGCTDEQLGLKTDSEPGCPDGSKLGTVEVTTPVLEETLSGDMVLRTPKSTDPMSGEMLRMALVVRNRERGLLVKLPGSATADPQTGRLVATFDDNPQLPIGTVEVKLKGGDRGVLAMGRDCGEVSTKTTLTPWSGNADAVSDTPLAVDQRCGNGFSPKLAAGSSDNRARGQGGVYSFRFSREDGEQWLRGLTAKLPKGLLASVRDVPLCPNALADAGNCPADSRIGVVDAKAGSGDPFVLEEKGEVFLTEGYKGGEYGLAVKVRPVAGPFRGQWELSPIIVRQAIHVDRTTAEVTAVSDPFPLIHHGVPLRVREVNVLVNRGGFMVNPSDCAAKQSSAQLLSDEGAIMSLSDRFQVSGCAALPFKPKLALSLTGKRQVTTGKHPGVKALVTQAGVSEAGIGKAVVRLPKSLALDPNNAQALCEFADGTKPDLENHCPKGSIVGRARARTPLLKDDLVGNVYFVKNVRRDPRTGNEIRTLPMIIVALRGEIAVNLKGESSTTKAGKLVNTFASVPDAPISRFNLNIQGGKNGILAVTRTRKAKINLCAGRHIAEADMDGQNGRRYDRDVRMKTPCTKKQTKNAKRAAKRAAAKVRAGSKRG